MTHAEEPKEGHFLLGLAVTAAIATGLGIFLRSEKGEEFRDEVSDRAKKIAKNFNATRAELQERVKETFGQVTDDLEEKYLEIQGMLMAQADDMKDGAEMSKEKYEEMVDKAVKKYAKGREWTTDAVGNLSRTLKRDWKNFKQDISS
ncbi:MAG: YtxH domain-containing protein [Patescibacteria group bacterium]